MRAVHMFRNSTGSQSFVFPQDFLIRHIQHSLSVHNPSGGDITVASWVSLSSTVGKVNDTQDNSVLSQILISWVRADPTNPDYHGSLFQNVWLDFIDIEVPQNSSIYLITDEISVGTVPVLPTSCVIYLERAR